MDFNLFLFDNCSEEQKRNIMTLTSIFENSDMELDFGYCEDIDDGRGYTAGISGFCSGTQDLVLVFKEYYDLVPGDNDAKELYKILKKTNDDKTKKLKDLPKFFKKHKDDELFKSAQITITNKLYVFGANKLCKKYGVKLPITIGEIFDACTNHGEDGAEKILKKIKLKIEDSEELWLEKFLKKRKKIILKDETWKNAVDRINVYEDLLKIGNVGLKSPFKVKCYGDKYEL